MKALTLWQPWASLVVTGEKQFETRSWKPSPSQLMSGSLLAIHASLKTVKAADLLWDDRVRERVERMLGEYEALPLGSVLGIMEFVWAWHAEELMDARAWTSMSDEARTQELVLGDFSPGRFAWLLKPVLRFDGKGIPARGRQGIWNFDFDAEMTEFLGRECGCGGGPAQGPLPLGEVEAR